jgi:xanthine dehydrogenase accessory factor
VSELDLLVREAAALRTAGVPFLLATVVAVRGSSYRREGARMLVADDRWIAGCVSGGCLEGDVVRRGAHRIRHGAPVVVTYDSTSDDDIGWGFGLGCNGVVEVLLERIDASAALDPLRFAGECIEAEQRGALVTVYGSPHSASPIGARLAVRSGAPTTSTIPRGEARDAIEELARRALDDIGDARPSATTASTHGLSVLIEVIEPPPRLFVCGAGHDAVPLVALARSMGWRVSVVAEHPSVTTNRRFALADELLPGPAGELPRAVARHTRSFAVIMSHDYDRDKACLRALLPSRVQYIGVLGPRRRTERMLAELSASGVTVTDDALRRLHAPVGLDLAAETPQEIALAIASEVQAAMTQAPARRLRERGGPIHAPAAESRAAAEADARTEAE